jgi:hypothetical protein
LNSFEQLMFSVEFKMGGSSWTSKWMEW